LLKLEARQDSDPCLNPWFRVRLCGRLLKGQADTTFLGNVVIAPIRVHGGRWLVKFALGRRPRWRPAAQRAEASQAAKARGILEAVNETEIPKESGMDAEKSAIEVAAVIVTKTVRRKKMAVAAVDATKTARRRKTAVAAEIATKTARRTKIAVVAAIVTKTAKGTKIAAAAVNATKTVIGTGIATEEVVGNAIETETGELHGDETKIEIATEAIAETVGIAMHVIAIVTEAIGEIEGHDRGHRGGRQDDHQGGRHGVHHDDRYGVRHGDLHGGLRDGLRGDLCGGLRGGQQGDLPGDLGLLDAVRHVAEAVTKAMTEERMATNVENAMVVARRVGAVPRQHGSQLSSPSKGSASRAEAAARAAAAAAAPAAQQQAARRRRRARTTPMAM